MKSEVDQHIHQLSNQVTILSGKVRLARGLAKQGDPQTLTQIAEALEVANDQLGKITVQLSSLKRLLEAKGTPS